MIRNEKLNKRIYMIYVEVNFLSVDNLLVFKTKIEVVIWCGMIITRNHTQTQTNTAPAK